MRQLKSVNQSETGESLGCSLFTIGFGLTFIAMGINALNSPWGLFRGGSDSLAYAPLAFLAFGLMMLWGGIHQTRLALKFGKAEVSIAEDVIRPGEEFHFLYQQPCRQQIEIKSISVFLVFRER